MQAGRSPLRLERTHDQGIGMARHPNTPPRRARYIYRDAMGLKLDHEDGDFAVFNLPDGSKVEV